jgi:HECT-domain (ubiquitin-transferase)
VRENMDVFLGEFYKVIPKDFIEVFIPEELEMVLFGLPFINLEEWKASTLYGGKYNSSHQVCT